MLPYLFVLLAIAVRFLPFVPVNFPHAWHFTPLAASLLFFGARGSKRQMWAPWLLLVAADVVITKFMYRTVFSWDQVVIWAWYAGILWLGTNLREKTTFWRVIAAALTSSLSFFVISNFAVWAAWPEMYPRSFAGLTTCYVAAIPFFRGTLQSDLFFSLAFFGPAMVAAYMGHRADRTATA